MITEQFSADTLMLISQLNSLFASERVLPSWGDLSLRLKEAALITDHGLIDWANEILYGHLNMAVAGPIACPVTKSYIVAVNAILETNKKGFGLFEATRNLLKSYLILNYSGYFLD